MATDNSSLPAERQTDKAKTKTVGCTICNRPLIVNTFYAPAKARCSEHKSANALAPIARAAVFVERQGVEVPQVEPNHSLRDLRCPFDSMPMTMIRVDERMGFMTMKCAHCGSAIEIKPNWAHAIISRIPEDLKPVVAEFNRGQIVQAASIELDRLEKIASTSGITTA